jgi:nitronate monooxygenase
MAPKDGHDDRGSKGLLDTPLTRLLGIEVPLVCGAMYPCSNPELVAAVSEAGGIGIVQPMAFAFIHCKDLRTGLREVRARTSKPIGLNLIIEKTAKVYEDRSRLWLDIALEEGVRFFVTALGKPDWVVQRVHAAGGVVFHDVTERKWAERALDHGVDGLIAVNNRAGGHAGTIEAMRLYSSLADLGVPVIGAGGVGDEAGFVELLQMGYAGVQLGTRFIASEECRVHADYKAAIVKARETDIVLTEKLSGVPVAVINTPYIQRIGTKAGPIARRLLRHPKGKHWMRTFYALQSVWQLKQAIRKGNAYKDYWQAGRSVEGIVGIEKAADIVHSYRNAAERITVA